MVFVTSDGLYVLQIVLCSLANMSQAPYQLSSRKNGGHGNISRFHDHIQNVVILMLRREFCVFMLFYFVNIILKQSISNSVHRHMDNIPVTRVRMDGGLQVDD